LWAIWDASGLASEWQQVSAAGGPAGAAADRDLDAVLALFDKAAHFTDSMPPGVPALFVDSLSSQEIAGDTLAERAVRDDCVRILTAHRSKGLEWDVVVVAGVQEETWPDLRMRGSLLGVDELAEAASGAAHPPEWYALTELSDSGPIVTGGEAVRLSPSPVESFTRCGLRRLPQAAFAAGRTDVLRPLGTVSHAAAVLAAEGPTERA